MKNRAVQLYKSRIEQQFFALVGKIDMKNARVDLGNMARSDRKHDMPFWVNQCVGRLYSATVKYVADQLGQRSLDKAKHLLKQTDVKVKVYQRAVIEVRSATPVKQ